MLACNHHAEQAYQQQRADSADAPSHLNVQDIKRHRAEQEHALDTDVSFPEPSCAVGALPPHMFDNMGRLQVLLHTPCQLAHSAVIWTLPWAAPVM